jgi:hypothetical protein
MLLIDSTVFSVSGCFFGVVLEFLDVMFDVVCTRRCHIREKPLMALLGSNFSGGFLTLGLWLKITEDEVKRSYERNATPDPTRYYVKDYPMYSTAYYPDLTMIPARVATSFPIIPPVSPAVVDTPRIYKCDLCNTLFNTEEEMNIHVTSNH